MIRALCLAALTGCVSPSVEHRIGLGLDGGAVTLDAGAVVDAAPQPAAYYVLSLDAAVIAQQTVDKALGMPLPGHDIGGGAHVPASQSVTTTYAAPQAVQGGYIYLADAVTESLLSDSGLPRPIAVAFVDAGPDGALIIADAGVSASVALSQLALP